MQTELEQQIQAQVPQMRDRDVVLSFSTGADSVACYLRMREWGIKPAALVYWEYLPGLPMVEGYIRWFEAWSGETIHRIPHPLGLSDLRNGLFQRPAADILMWRHSEIKKSDLDKKRLNSEILACFDRNPIMVIGLRYGDGFFRWKHLMESGPLRGNQWNPTASFTDSETSRIIREHGCRLPYEYGFLGRSFESPRPENCEKMEAHAPITWRAMCEAMPLLPLLLAQRKLLKPLSSVKKRITLFGPMALECEVMP